MPQSFRINTLAFGMSVPPEITSVKANDRKSKMSRVTRMTGSRSLKRVNVPMLAILTLGAHMFITPPRAAVEGKGAASKKLPSPVVNATVTEGPHGEIVLTIPAEYRELAFKRALLAPKGYTDEAGKTTEYPWGCMVQSGEAGFNSFFLGVSKKNL